MKSWNRFNGFPKIPVFLGKPLKRLTAFQSHPNPKLKLGENENLILQESLKADRTSKPSSATLPIFAIMTWRVIVLDS